MRKLKWKERKIRRQQWDEKIKIEGKKDKEATG